MPVTIKVNGTVNSLVHKFSSGISMATIPDVCKTPSPGGPVPIPYPNIAQSITLSDGTTTVKGDKTMAAIKGSKFAMSNGDNAGTLGGVKSSTFMKEATWILYSFDVNLNGKGAARLTDKMFHNHENAANLAGVVQQALMDAGLSEAEANAICEALCETQAEYDKGNLRGRGRASKDFEDRLNKLKQEGKLGEGISPEQPYFMPTDLKKPPVPIEPMMEGNVLDKLVNTLLTLNGSHPPIELNAAGEPSRKFIRQVCSLFKDHPSQRTVRFPDLVIDRAGKRQVFDAKFNYEKILGPGKRDKFNDDQISAYRRISKPPGQEPTAMTPEDCGCPGYTK